MNKIVVLMKTHVWSDDLEKFALKIYNETSIHNIDFFILMHCETNDFYDKIKDDQLKNIILKFTEAEIKGIYPIGFYSMWLSNHWILMWFYRQFRDKYQYFWSIEYDVRISGDSSKIWLHDSTDDFLYTRGFVKRSKYEQIHRNNYIGAGLTDKRFGHLQLARYSNQALASLDQCYEAGENGQDELITYSLIIRRDLSRSNKYLLSLIRGTKTWTTDDRRSTSNKLTYERLEEMRASGKIDKLYIFHPVK